MRNIRKHFDLPSIFVIAITFVLFAFALFSRGLTHDLFLETAVFLVSVKLILSSYRHGVVTEETRARLEALAAAVKRVERTLDKGEKAEQPETLEAGRVM